MTHAIAPQGLDVRALAQSGGSLGGVVAVTAFARVAESLAEGAAPATVRWAARGELRAQAGAAPQVWLHLQADAQLPLTCQRCLGTVQTPVQVDRWFRFVADEATALEQDETADEDILVLAPEFDLHALIEDELLLDLPFVPRHAACPTQGPTAVADAGFAEPAARPNPFASLAALKRGDGEGQG